MERFFLIRPALAVFGVLLFCGLARAETTCVSSGGLEGEPAIHALQSLSGLSGPRQLSEDQKGLYDRYLSDTLNSLERMRTPSGLVVDKVEFVKSAPGSGRYKVLNPSTSPTNVGLDILIQLELLRDPQRKTQAAANLRKSIDTLARIPHHRGSGLFYSWFDAANGVPVQKNVSSVDNIHLALALWSAAKTAPDDETRKRAQVLFDRMNFSPFVDPQNGLMGGNLKHELKAGKDSWTREPWNYSNFGAEARSLYSLTHALGLLRDHKSDQLVRQSAQNIKVETADTRQGEILRTWDGGAFQLLLPRTLIQEERYSARMKQYFENYSRHVLEQQKREDLPLPASYSACNLAVDGDEQRFKGVPSYAGQAGSPELVSLDHEEIHRPESRKNWDRVVTPHAMVLAATIEPSQYASRLAAAEKLGSSQKLYEPGLGWMDAYHVRHEYRGKVVPVQLSLDQSMLALSVMEIRSTDGKTVSSRLLAEDPLVKSKVQEFYSAIEPRLRPQSSAGK